MQKTKFLYCFLFLVFSLIIIFSSLFLKQIIFSNLSTIQADLYTFKKSQNVSLTKFSTIKNLNTAQTKYPTQKFSKFYFSQNQILKQSFTQAPNTKLFLSYTNNHSSTSLLSNSLTSASEITTVATTATANRYLEILVDTPLFKTTTDDDQNLAEIYFLLPKSYYVEVIKECTLDSGALGYKVNYGDFSGFARASDLSTEYSSTSTTQIGTEITLYSDAGTYIRSTPTISDNRIRIIPQGTSGIVYLGSIYGDNPSDGTSSLWYLVEYNFGDTSTVLGYIYSERTILSTPLVELEKPQVSDNTETAPTTQTADIPQTTQKTTLSLSISPALKWIIALLFIIPAIVIFLLLVKKPKRQILENDNNKSNLDNFEEIFENSNAYQTQTNLKSNYYSTEPNSTALQPSNFTDTNTANQNLDILPEFANFSDIQTPTEKKSKFFKKNKQMNQNLQNNTKKIKFSRDFEPFVNFKTTLEVSKELDPVAQKSTTSFSNQNASIDNESFSKNLTLLSENPTNNFSKNYYNSSDSSNQNQFKNKISFNSTPSSLSGLSENKNSPINPTRLENSYDEYYSDTQKLKRSIENSNPISRPTFPKISIDDSEFGEDFTISTPFSSVLGTTPQKTTRRRFDKK